MLLGDRLLIVYMANKERIMNEYNVFGCHTNVLTSVKLKPNTIAIGLYHYHRYIFDIAHVCYG